MAKTAELKEKLSSLTEIFIDTKENFRYCYYLHYSEIEEERKYLAIDRHLQFIRHSLWRLTVIEVCKLFSNRDNDKYNIQRLIKSFKPGKHFGKIGLESSKLSEWENEIANKEKVIENLITLRDKFYAHSDAMGAIDKDVNIYFQDIFELLELANQIIRNVSIKIGEPVLILDSPYFESQELNLVKVLTRDHIQMLKKYDSC